MIRNLSVLLAVVLAGIWLSGMRTAQAGDCPTCQTKVGPLIKPLCINVAWSPGPHHCKPLGYWHAPYSTPFLPICTPLFFGGAPFIPNQPDPDTVIRLSIIPTGKPKEPKPQRPITSEPVRPPRPPIDIETPIDRPPVLPMTSAHVHVLTLVDNDAKDMGKIHTAGADAFMKLLKAGIRAERFGTVARLDSADLTATTIAQKIKDLDVKPEDAVVAFYFGPAEFNDATMGFNLTPSQAQGRIPREDVRKQLEAKNARLTVFLSDPASDAVKVDPSNKTELPEPTPTALERLFFGYKGVVDVHGCSAGEFAAARGTAGGCFTLAFIREFGRPAGSWADLLEGVKFTTNNLYKSYRLDVLRSDDLAAPAKATFRNQESQIPALLTPIDNVKTTGPGVYVVPELLPPVTLTVETQRKPAQLQIRVPLAAALWIDGRPTTQVGIERLFETSAIEVDRQRQYEIRVELNGWVGVYQVAVIGGQSTKVELVIPETIAGR